MAGHSRGFIAKVLAGAMHTRSRAVKYGTMVGDECPVCEGVADTQEHRVMDCKSSNRGGDRSGRQAWSVLDLSLIPI